MNISEKVAYIKGLAEGLSVDDKVVNASLDVLGDIAKEIASLKEDTEYLDSYIEEIDEDLGALEEEYYGSRKSDGERQRGTDDRKATERHMRHESLKSGF